MSRLWVKVWLALAAGTLGVVGCLGVSVDDRDRPELSGAVGGGGFGGIPVGVGGTVVTTTTTSTTTTTTTTAGVGGSTCDPAYELNDSEDTAFDLGDINDCDGNGSMITAALQTGDIDWYRYDGSDDFGCVANPVRALSSSDNVRLCKFVECNSGQVDVTCEDGATPATSPNGRLGCCHNTGFTINIECPGIDDDITAFIRLDQPAGACVSYTLSYHF